MEQEVEKLAELFQGLDRAHGEYKITGTATGKKKKTGSAITYKKPPTLDLWKRHVKGEYGLGIVPITDEATCSWGAIDVDVYDVDIDALEKKILELKLPLLICRSKSRGLHLFLFCKKPLPAELIRETLVDWATRLGYPGIEVFPKQVKLADSNDVGNWLNMPYFGGTRLGYQCGKDLTLSEFLETASLLKVDTRKLNKINAALEASEDASMVDAPPCLQYLAEYGIESGHRNDALFNFAVYYRLKHPNSDVAEYLAKANSEYCQDPLQRGELAILAKSVERREYFYRCEQPPICNHCNKEVCATRKYGIGKPKGGLLVPLTGLTRFETDPPIWYLNVNATRVELDRKELMHFRLLKEKCLEVVNVVIGSMKQMEWEQEVLPKLLDDCVIVEVPEDAGTRGQFRLLVNDFLTSRVVGSSLEELTMGVPYYNKEENRYYFRSSDLEEHLKRRNFTKYATSKIYAELHELGCQKHQFRIKGVMTRAWSVPPLYENNPEELDVPTMTGEPY